jgi:HAD superfamily hydrolase (TIGR01509 family)
MKIKGMLFDLDGVVIDSERYSDKVTANLLRKFGYEYEVNKIKPKMVGIPDVDGMQILVDYYKLPITAEEFDERRRDKKALFYKEKIPFMPGFESFYEKLLNEYPVKSAIVTSCKKEYYDLIDKRLHITELFKRHIYRTDMVKHHKPAPDLFLYGAKKLGVSAKECIAFEDAPSGIVSAMRSGAKVVVLTTTFNKNILLKNSSEIIGRKIKETELLFVSDFKKSSAEKIFGYLRKLEQQ